MPPAPGWARSPAPLPDAGPRSLVPCLRPPPKPARDGEGADQTIPGTARGVSKVTPTHRGGHRAVPAPPRG